MFQIKLLTIILFWVLTFIVLVSCTCVKLPSYLSNQEYNSIDIIVKAKVLYTRLMEDKKHSFTVFKIMENYKPEVKEKVIKIISPIDPESCGISFEANQDWLLFAYKKDTVYTTSKCTRSMEFIDQKDYKLYTDSFIKTYHKNILFLKSKLN